MVDTWLISINRPPLNAVSLAIEHRLRRPNEPRIDEFPRLLCHRSFFPSRVFLFYCIVYFIFSLYLRKNISEFIIQWLKLISDADCISISTPSVDKVNFRDILTSRSVFKCFDFSIKKHCTLLFVYRLFNCFIMFSGSAGLMGGLRGATGDFVISLSFIKSTNIELFFNILIWIDNFNFI